MFVPLNDSDGNPTKIAAADLTKAALQAKFDEENSQDRFYPLPLMENVTDERAEPTMYEWEGGGKVFIKENPRAFSGMIKRLTPELIGRIKNWTGQEMGYYVWDADGNFIYSAASDGSTDLYPIEIDGESLYAGLVKATNSDPLMGAVTFDTAQGVQDEDLRYVKKENLDFNGLSKSDVYGLMEVKVNITAATASTVTFSLALDQNVALSGMTVSDLVANNDTNDAAITLSTVTESGVNAGTYTGAYSPGLAVGETIRITVSKSKLSFGYDTYVATA